jgi:hypothetical protein
MSSPAQGGPAVPKDKERRLSRVLTRVKTVFKKPDAKRNSQAGPSTTAAGTTAGTTSAPVLPPAESAEGSTRYVEHFFLACDDRSLRVEMCAPRIYSA